MRWTFRGGRSGRRTGWRAGAVTLAATALLAAGCGGLSGSGQPQAQGGSLAQSGINLAGQTYTVGGKEFDEQLVLCHMTIAALQSVGAVANDRCNITGTASTRAALVGGQIDMYWEYTGTGWITHLKNATPIPDSQQQYVAVRDADLAQNHIVWLPPSPFNNTYGLAVTQPFAQQNNLRTLTDWGNFTNSGNPLASLCVEAEFAGRDDGLAGLYRTYGVTNPPSGPPLLNTLDTGAIYQATANGNPCHFGEVFTTDGRIPGLNLTTLQDDKNYFPKYNASPTIRQEVFDRNPSIQRVFDAITPRLTDQVMLDLNGQVSSQGQDPTQVATRWLQQQGFIGGG